MVHFEKNTALDVIFVSREHVFLTRLGWVMVMGVVGLHFKQV
jgi:hypothetical protein